MLQTACNFELSCLSSYLLSAGPKRWLVLLVSRSCQGSGHVLGSHCFAHRSKLSIVCVAAFAWPSRSREWWNSRKHLLAKFTTCGQYGACVVSTGPWREGKLRLRPSSSCWSRGRHWRSYREHCRMWTRPARTLQSSWQCVNLFTHGSCLFIDTCCGACAVTVRC